MRDVDPIFQAALRGTVHKNLMRLVEVHHPDLGSNYFRLNGRGVRWASLDWQSNKGNWSGSPETIEQEDPSEKLELQDRDKRWRKIINEDRTELNGAVVILRFALLAVEPPSLAFIDRFSIVDKWVASGYLAGGFVQFNLQMPYNAIDAEIPWHSLGGRRCRHTWNDINGFCQPAEPTVPCNQDIPSCLKNYAGTMDDPLRFSAWPYFDKEVPTL